MKFRLTVRNKLGLGVLALGLSLLVFSFTSLRAIGQLGVALDAAVNNTARKMELVGSTQAAFQELKHETLREQIAYTIQELERQPAGERARRSMPAPAAPLLPCASDDGREHQDPG